MSGSTAYPVAPLAPVASTSSVTCVVHPTLDEQALVLISSIASRREVLRLQRAQLAESGGRYRLGSSSMPLLDSGGSGEDPR